MAILELKCTDCGNTEDFFKEDTVKKGRFYTAKCCQCGANKWILKPVITSMTNGNKVYNCNYVTLDSIESRRVTTAENIGQQTLRKKIQEEEKRKGGV